MIKMAHILDHVWNVVQIITISITQWNLGGKAENMKQWKIETVLVENILYNIMANS